MRKTIALLAVISILLSGCSYSKQYGNEVNGPTSTSTMPSTETEISYPPFEPMEGYDQLQTVFLTFDKDTTSEEVIITLNAAGLYFSDKKTTGKWYFEIAHDEPVDWVYGTNIYDTDTIELCLKETEDGVFLVESMTYYFYGKGVKAIYDFDRGYSESDLEKAVEAFVFVDTNTDTGYTFATIDGKTRQEILDLGIEYEKNQDTENSGE